MFSLKAKFFRMKASLRGHYLELGLITFIIVGGKLIFKFFPFNIFYKMVSVQLQYLL